SREGGRLQGKRLRRRVPFAGRITRRDRSFFDAEDGLSRFAVENKHPALLVHRRKCGNGFSVLLDIEQNWRRWKIRVPEIVMDCLEVPLQLSSLGVDRNDGVAEEIIPRPIASPVIARWRSERHIKDASLLVESHVPA